MGGEEAKASDLISASPRGPQLREAPGDPPGPFS